MNAERRADDMRVQRLVTDVCELKRQMKENTEITAEVRDILTSFYMLLKVTKWVSAVGAGVAAGFAAVKGWRL